MADVEGSVLREQPQLSSAEIKRRARRKRVLDNAGARMNRLKSTQRSTSLCTAPIEQTDRRDNSRREIEISKYNQCDTVPPVLQSSTLLDSRQIHSTEETEPSEVLEGSQEQYSIQNEAVQVSEHSQKHPLTLTSVNKSEIVDEFSCNHSSPLNEDIPALITGESVSGRPCLTKEQTMNEEHNNKIYADPCKQKERTQSEKSNDKLSDYAHQSKQKNNNRDQVLGRVKKSNGDKLLEEEPSVQNSLSQAVNVFGSERAWKLRTYLAVICAALCVVWNLYSTQELSSVVMVVSVDMGLIVFLATIWPSHNIAESASTSVAWLSFLRIPIIYLPAVVAKTLDLVLLFMYIVLQCIRDIGIMLFTTVIIKCIHLIIIK